MKKNSDLDLEVGDLVVYPIYGVGEVENFDKYEIDGSSQDFILINFKPTCFVQFPKNMKL